MTDQTYTEIAKKYMIALSSSLILTIMAQWAVSILNQVAPSTSPIAPLLPLFNQTSTFLMAISMFCILGAFIMLRQIPTNMSDVSNKDLLLASAALYGAILITGITMLSSANTFTLMASWNAKAIPLTLQTLGRIVTVAMLFMAASLMDKRIRTEHAILSQTSY